MNPREFLLLADELVKSGGRAKYRSAISRAYYAAFHIGSETLRQLGFVVSKGGAAHGEVTRYLMNSLDQQTEAAARSLVDLHTSRLRADYQLGRTDVEELAYASRVVNNARVVIESFEKLSTSPQRAQIQAAIATWRKSNGYP